MKSCSENLANVCFEIIKLNRKEDMYKFVPFLGNYYGFV